MKFFIIPLLCLMSSLSIAQLKVSKDVIENYNVVVGKLPLNYQKVLKQQLESIQTPDNLSGFAIATIYNIDTINKKEAPDYSSIYIYSIDTNHNTGKVEMHEQFANSTNENIYEPVPCTVLLKGNSLSIITPSPFNPYVIHNILRGKVNSTYEEYQKQDTIYRLNLTNPKTERLSIPVNVSTFKLNTTNFKVGKVLYGEVEFVTADYYVDNSAFKSGFIHKRLLCRYVFRGIITR